MWVWNPSGWQRGEGCHLLPSLTPPPPQYWAGLGGAGWEAEEAVLPGFWTLEDLLLTGKAEGTASVRSCR